MESRHTLMPGGCNVFIHKHVIKLISTLFAHTYVYAFGSKIFYFIHRLLLFSWSIRLVFNRLKHIISSCIHTLNIRTWMLAYPSLLLVSNEKKKNFWRVHVITIKNSYTEHPLKKKLNYFNLEQFGFRFDDSVRSLNGTWMFWDKNPKTFAKSSISNMPLFFVLLLKMENQHEIRKKKKNQNKNV